MPEALELVRPAHLWVPDRGSTAGPEAADFAEAVGLVLDDEQRLALDVLLAERPDGRWAAFEAAVVASRQNLKTFVVLVACLSGVYLHDVGLTVWTAHEFNTAMEAFRDTKILIETHAFLSRRVKRVIEGSGEEGIEFMTGQRFRFKARTKSGGRGLSGDRVVLDEAQELRPAHMASLMPTMSAKSVTGNPQLIYGGSAGFDYSAVWRNIRDRGRAGGDPSLAYVEWCAPRGCADEKCDHHRGAHGCALDDPEKWRQANPAMDRRISQAFIAGERRALDPIDFARERLGWWEDPAEITMPFPLEAWEACIDMESEPGTKVHIAFDVNPERSMAAIALASRRPDGMVHIASLEYRSGTGWVAGRLKELKDELRPASIRVAPNSPAGSLIADVKAAKVELTEVNSTHHAHACGAFYDAVVEGGLRHLDQLELFAALEGAAKQPLSDAWLWSRKNSNADICSLVAATLALGGVVEKPKNRSFAY